MATQVPLWPLGSPLPGPDVGGSTLGLPLASASTHCSEPLRGRVAAFLTTEQVPPKLGTRAGPLRVPRSGPSTGPRAGGVRPGFPLSHHLSQSHFLFLFCRFRITLEQNHRCRSAHTPPKTHPPRWANEETGSEREHPAAWDLTAGAQMATVRGGPGRQGFWSTFPHSLCIRRCGGPTRCLRVWGTPDK